MKSTIVSKTKEWDIARKRLKGEYEGLGITRCELNFRGCMGSWWLGFAHRYKRNDPRCQHTFEDTILACNVCHLEIEYNRQKSDKMFRRLRDDKKEIL